MSEPLAYELITADQLLDKARSMHEQGYRLVHISATRLPDQVELTYGFDLNGQAVHFRLVLPATGVRLPSISAIYWCAFIYENEIHDLFDLPVDNMAVDFQGVFYKTTVKFPFGRVATPAAKPAASAVAASPLPPSTS